MLIILMMCLRDADAAIALVQNGEIDIRPGYAIGAHFEAYPYWTETDWRYLAQPNELVVFTGTYSQQHAAESFQSHQYEWELSLKSIQLHNVYGIDKDGPKQQAFEVVFALKGDSFSVASGAFLFRNQESQAWQRIAMSDRAVLAVVKAMFRPTDPYAVLIKGLPY